MTEEFNLSRKFHFGDDGVFQDNGERYYLEEDVKEFIRLLKEKFLKMKGKDIIWMSEGRMNQIIDKLSGEKLVEEK